MLFDGFPFCGSWSPISLYNLTGDGIGEAPNKRIGGSGSLARLLPYPFWFLSVSAEGLCNPSAGGIDILAFFHTLLLLASALLWLLLFSAVPRRWLPFSRFIRPLAAKPLLQTLIPLGAVCRVSGASPFADPRRKERRAWPPRRRHLCFMVLYSCPRLVWAVPEGIPGPNEGFAPHFVGPSLAEVIDRVMPEPLPVTTEPPDTPVTDSGAGQDSYDSFREAAVAVRETSLVEACEAIVRSPQRGAASTSAPGSRFSAATVNAPVPDESDFEDLSADIIDARDQHVQSPGTTKLLPILLAAPGYPLETVWISTTIPATVNRVCSDVKSTGSSLFGEIGDTLTPTHPQLEIGLASFVVTPPWFPEANLVAVLIDARAIQGTVFAAVLTYPTCLEEIRRVAGFVTAAAHEVYVAGDNDPLLSDRPVPLQSGVLVKFLPPDRTPLWGPPLAFALWHPYMWPAGASIPPKGYGLRALLLHSAGKYVLDSFSDDDWANLNNVARIVDAPLAELSVEPASQEELFPYVYHGSRIRCVLAITPKPPPRSALGKPLSYVLFIDSRPVGFDVNFLCLDQGHIQCDQLLQLLQQPPPPGWRLVVRGGQKRGQGYDFVHGEVLTLALARLGPQCEENPESEEGFSPDDEEPFDGSSSERNARTRTRSRTPGRGPSPKPEPDASSDHSYQGFDTKVHKASQVCDLSFLQDFLPVSLCRTFATDLLHTVPRLCFRVPAYELHRVTLSERAGRDGRPTLPPLREIGDRSPERPPRPDFAVDPPAVMPAQPVIVIRGLFVILVERYRPEVVPLDLRLPIDIASVREAIQEVRLPLCKLRFPYLVPMPYQPCEQFAVFLAAPAWMKDEVEVAFDCREIGGMLHSKCVPMLQSFQQLREAAGVIPWLPVEVWVEPFREPVPSHRILHVYAGSLIVFRHIGQGCPVLHHLSDMIRRVAGWDQLADLPFSFEPAVWILADEGPFRFLIDPAHGGLRRQDVAHALDYDPARVILVPPEPPIRDFSQTGLCTSAAIVVSQTIPSIRGPRYGPCVVFLDQRPLLADLSWMVCPDGLFHLSTFVEAFPRRCPPGFQVTVWGAFPIAGTDRYRVVDGTKLTFTFELIQPSLQGSRTAGDGSDSESSESRHTLMSDSGSDASRNTEASPQGPPAGPPPPAPVHRGTGARCCFTACITLHSLLAVQPVAATQICTQQVLIAWAPCLAAVPGFVLQALFASYAVTLLPFWSLHWGNYVCRLLCDLIFEGTGLGTAYRNLRDVMQQMALPWPLDPPHTFVPDIQGAEDTDLLLQSVTLGVSCVILKPDYTPEEIATELVLPCVLEELVDELQALRSTPDFLMFPHLLHVNPQPIHGLAVFLALPRWHPTATVICLNTASIDGRIFATYAPDRLTTDELVWLADLPSQVDYVVYVGGDDQPLPAGIQVHIAPGDQVVFVEHEGAPLPDLTLPLMLLRPDQWQHPGNFPAPRVREAYCLALREHQVLHIEDFSQPARFQARLAHSAGLPPTSVHVLWADPPVHSIALFGVPCRTLLAACVCGRDADECLGIFFDLRPIQEGLRFVCRTCSPMNLTALLQAFDTGAPFGWRTQLWAFGQEGAQSPEVHPGATLVASYVPRVDPADQLLATAAPPAFRAAFPEVGDASTLRANLADPSNRADSHSLPVESAAEGDDPSGDHRPQSRLPGNDGSTPPPSSAPDSSEGDGGADRDPDDQLAAHPLQTTAGEANLQPFPFLLFSVEYQPEGLLLGLHPPFTLTAALAAIEQRRAPTDHRRTPRIIAVHPAATTHACGAFGPP